MVIIQHDELLDLLRFRYSLQDVERICSLLKDRKTLNFRPLANGLFSASSIQSKAHQYTGYSNVWVRDNIHIAYAHYINGYHESAFKNLSTLATYFREHEWKFHGIIEGTLDAGDPMNRPHVRFNGNTLEEVNQKWAHAQNDALGYFLWLFCKLSNAEGVCPCQEDMELLALFPLYFNAIRFWEDEDSGHWEETRKIEASSIGVVTGALREYKHLLTTEACAKYFRDRNIVVAPDLVDELIIKGKESLEKILPAECIQPDPAKRRRYDAALLFLIFPIDIVTEDMADQVLTDVIGHLQGDYGIRRYLGDSFWCRDYKDIPPEVRTIISSEREEWLKEHRRELKVREEAQWCIFDPIISAIFGAKYRKHHKKEDLENQTRYFNRSLGQLTGRDSSFGEFKCPELYYIENGKYIPNDSTPLLWTQANLWIAVKFMEQSLCS